MGKEDRRLTTSHKLKIQSAFCTDHLSSSIELLRKRWDELITENTLALATSHFHLQTDTKIVHRTGENPKNLPRWGRNRILPALRDKLKEVEAFELEVTQDHSMLSAYMSAVLNRSHYLEDVFSIVPDELHKPIERAVGVLSCGHASNAQLPADVAAYHDKAINWVKVQNVRNFLLGK